MPKHPKTTEPLTLLPPTLPARRVRAPKRPKLKDKRYDKPKVVKVDDTTDLTTVARVLMREGGDAVDLGIILGCRHIEGVQDWLDAVKAEGLTVPEFMEVVKQRADIELIRIAVKAATGYTYEEESQEFHPVPVEGKDGTVTVKEYTPGKKKITKKRATEDSALLWHLLKSRMPAFFSDVTKIEVTKRTLEIKATAEAEIRGFTAGLLKAFGEPVDAEFVKKAVEQETEG